MLHPRSHSRQRAEVGQLAPDCLLAQATGFVTQDSSEATQKVLDLRLQEARDGQGDRIQTFVVT